MSFYCMVVFITSSFEFKTSSAEVRASILEASIQLQLDCNDRGLEPPSLIEITFWKTRADFLNSSSNSQCDHHVGGIKEVVFLDFLERMWRVEGHCRWKSYRVETPWIEWDLDICCETTTWSCLLTFVSFFCIFLSSLSFPYSFCFLFLPQWLSVVCFLFRFTHIFWFVSIDSLPS